MQPINSYSSFNDKLRLLLQGPSGSGKTTLACQFPKPYVIDIDVNLGGTLRWLKEQNLQLPVGYDVLDKDDEGKEVAIQMRYARLRKCLLDAQANDSIDTIILDSGTTLADVLIAEVLRQQNKSAIADFKDGRQFWGFFAILGRNFMSILAQMRKHIVLIVHEKILTDANGSLVYPIKVAWPGQVGQNLGVFFTNVWRCEVQTKVSGIKTEYQWLIRTIPEYRYELKNTLGVPPLFAFDWKTIQDRLDTIK